MTTLETIGENSCFGGRQLRFRHSSQALDCEMTFSIFLPSSAGKGSVPLLYWLSGLTCTDENFVTKAGAQQYAEKFDIAIVAPDTSPRGEGVPEDPDGHWDFGLGAGFYVNATQSPWSKHYRMYDYVVKELPAIIDAEFPVDPARTGIFGHSMGGHGALTIALKNPQNFRSVSAFAPICSPINCPWGEKALSNYLGTDRDLWREYDSCHLVREATDHLPVLVDQGGADNFLREQLKTELLMQAGMDSGYPMDIRLHSGYDHSYFFMASFMEEHIRFHSKFLM